MSNETTVYSLLQGLDLNNPDLQQLLLKLSDDVYKISNFIFPPSTVSFGTTGQFNNAVGVTGLTVTPLANDIRITWANAGNGIDYEIRYKLGVAVDSDWDFATILLRTSTLQADINPLTVPIVTGAVHSFLMKTIDQLGTYSDDIAIASLNVPQITAPYVVSSVIRNNVMLQWSIPISMFQIDHYNVYKNGVLQGTVSGTFEAFFELVGGIYQYTVQAVDFIGNLGIVSNIASVTLTNAEDYTLVSTLNSHFNGTKVNCITQIQEAQSVGFGFVV